MLKITINTDNAAFDEGNKDLEIARILYGLSDKLANGEYPSVVRDINGNKVGLVEYEGE